MARIIWTGEALADVNRLYLFLVKKNQDAANRAAQAILEAVNLLELHPEIGRLADDVMLFARELVIPFASTGYLALYRFDGNDAVILAVRHQLEVGYLL